MDFDYEEYEKKCDEIRNENYKLLELFASDLDKFAQKTVDRHAGNVEFFINNYLLREDALTFEYGIEKIDDFLGNFFIRKCAWSTPGSIRSTAASIKKFYKSMLFHGKIKKEDYDSLCEEIEIGLPEWQATCEQYNDPVAENPFYFF